MNGIKIRGTGHCVPEKIVTNDDMAKIVDTSDEWITTRTGISRRRHCTTESHEDLCREAAKMALRNAGVKPEQIGACIVATLTADTQVPSAACRVQAALGLPNDMPCFDLNAACTGFLFALHTMECLLHASERKFGLVIGAELLTRITDWEDRGTCVLFGDAAGAVVVESRQEWPSIQAVLGVKGEDQLLRVPGIGSDKKQVISMQGAGVFRFAVETVPHCIDQVLAKAGKTMDEVDFIVFHQANARIIDLVVKKYKIPQEKYYKNIGEYGNTSAASIPLVISELAEMKKIGSGSRLLVVGFGGGLTWGGALVELA